MKETDALDEYILLHIDEEGDYLKALYRATHVKLLRPRMASDIAGADAEMFVRMIRPKQVLEIGTYSGYSALCLAEGWKTERCSTPSRSTMSRKTSHVRGWKILLMPTGSVLHRRRP